MCEWGDDGKEFKSTGGRRAMGVMRWGVGGGGGGVVT